MNLATATNAELDAHILHTDQWGEPDWSVFEDTRGQLPEFPEAVLSPEIREYVTRAARGAGVTFAHVAVPLLCIASGIIGASRRVQASRSFIQPLSIWGAIVGNSGSGKTPGFSVVTRALAEIERQQSSRLGELQRAHETKAEAAKVALKQWTAAVEEAVEAGRSAPPKPPEAVKVGPFTRPRLYVSDVTIERVAVLIQARPAGLAAVVDELAGLFANMNRYSQGSDREFWLEAWNGNPYTVERMGREPIVLERLLVSIAGGFQPDKLARAFEGDNDGMYARLCFSWPSEAGYHELSNDVAEVEPEIVNALSELARLGEPNSDGTFNSRAIPLSPSAAAEFETFRQFLHAGKNELDDREREWWAKGAAQVLRIAGTLAMLEWAWRNDGPEPREISEELIEAAACLWRDYFWLHSRTALRQLGATKKRSNERRVLRWVKKTRPEILSIKAVRRDALAQAMDAKETEHLLDGLSSSGWLRKHTSQTGGRPAHRWAVNPILYRGAENAGSAERVNYVRS